MRRLLAQLGETNMARRLSVVFVSSALLGSIAFADDDKQPEGAGVGVGVGVDAGSGSATVDATATVTSPGGQAEPASEPDAAKKQGKGSFDAGGQLRFPSGPDEMGQFGTFNWVALDLKGRYFITDGVTVTGTIPLAPVKQGDAEVFGGFTVRPDVSLGGMLGVGLTLGMLRERAMLLSEKDAPIYLGDLKFGVGVGPYMKIKKFGLDLNVAPSVVYQAGSDDGMGGNTAVTAIQVPAAAAVSVGKMLKASVEVGLYTGDDFKLGAADGGRIALGAAVDIKLGKIIAHLGAGVASLITDPAGAYPSISDSIYIDLNAKFAK